MTIYRHRIKALVDSGAAYTIISSKTVEKYWILYRVKETLILIVLANEKLIEYGNGIIRLETKTIDL